LVRTDPLSPSNARNPHVIGSAEAGSTVRIFADACLSAAIATGSAAALASSGIAVEVPPNTTTVLYANATSATGATSDCSAMGLTYTHDGLPPSVPVLTGTNPSSPANNNHPALLGESDADTDIHVYTDPQCNGSTLVIGAVDLLLQGRLIVDIPDNTTLTFYARAFDRAGNASGCSNGITYVEDSIAPAAPTLTGTSPSSPANENHPRVLGSAEAGASVRIFGDAMCALVIGEGTAEDLAAGGIPVAVDDNTTTTFYAQAEDAAGNLSACSDTGILYVEDSTPPAPPILLSTMPPSPSNASTTPNILGRAEPGSSVQLYTDADCRMKAGVPTTADANGSFSVPEMVAENSTTTFYANATDISGNASTCSSPISYTSDTIALPPDGLATLPSSPANANRPSVTGHTEPGALVRIYRDEPCTGDATAMGVADSSGAFSIEVSVEDNTTSQFYANMTDLAGNTSGCSQPVSYVEDSAAPRPPVLTGTLPRPPANENHPLVVGTAEPLAVVRVYANNVCTGVPVTSGPVDASGNFQVPVTVPDNSSTTFYADAMDAAGNVSGCSPSGVTYIEDSGLPSAPVLVTSVPSSPATNNAPRIMGSADAGTTVRLYLDPACTMFAAQGDATTFASPGIQVSVADNTTTTFYATATKMTGSVSACSTTFVTYKEDSVAPTVASVTPPNGSLGVPLTTVATATFSEPMDPATISGTTFAVTGNGSLIAGNVSYNGTTATFTPSGNLPYGITFTATVSTGAKDLAGNPLAAPFSWTFATPPPPDTTPPTVQSVTPLAGASQVDWTITVTATFSEPMDPSTVNAQSFLVTEVGTPVEGTVTYSGNTATFTPSRALSLHGPYKATITTAVRDLAGNAMVAPFSWNFSTKDGQWGSVQYLPITTNLDTDVYISVANDGTAVAIESEQPQPGAATNGVYVQRFDPDGGTWSGRRLLDDSATLVQPTAAATAAGNMIAIWRHRDVGLGECLNGSPSDCTMSSRYDAQSQSWSPMSVVDHQRKGCPDWSRDPTPMSVGLASSGAVIVNELLQSSTPSLDTTTAGNPENWAVHYDPTLATWSTPVLLSNDPSLGAALAGGNRPQMLIASDGSAIVSINLCTWRYDPTLTTWSPPVCRYATPGSVSGWAIAMNSVGDGILVWNESGPSTNLGYVDRFDTAAGQWQGPSSIPNAPGWPTNVALDGLGSATVIWGNTSAPKFQVFSSRYDAVSGLWQDPVRVQDQVDWGWTAGFDAAGRGALLVSKQSGKYLLRFYPDVGWQPPSPVTWPSFFTHLALDGRGRGFAFGTYPDFGFSNQYARFE
jgi:hypothetical protein